MPADPITNLAKSTVQAGSTIIGSPDSPRTVVLETGDGADWPAGAEYNVLVWPPALEPTRQNGEFVRVTRAADVLTTTARGQEGTTPLSTIAAGYQVMRAITAKDLDDAAAAIVPAYVGSEETGTGTWTPLSAAVLFPFELQDSGTVDRAWIDIGSSAGNYDVGIYTEGGVRRVSKGTTAVPGPALLEASFAATTLERGRYWLAWAFDAAVVVGATNPIAARRQRVVAASMPLPASLAPGATPPNLGGGALGVATTMPVTPA